MTAPNQVRRLLKTAAPSRTRRRPRGPEHALGCAEWLADRRVPLWLACVL